MPTVLLAIAGLAYLLSSLVVGIWRGIREQVTWILVLFLVVAAGTAFLQAFWHVVGTPTIISNPLPFYNTVLMAFLYFHLSRSFLHISDPNQNWWPMGIGVMLLAVFAFEGLYAASRAEVSLARFGTSYGQVAFFILVTAWTAFYIVITLMTFRAFRRNRSPLHRNRIKYWMLSLGFFWVSDVMVFFINPLLGSGIRLGATLLIIYAIMAYRLFDVSQIIRKVISYFVISMMTVSLYLVIIFVFRGMVLRGRIPEFAVISMGVLVVVLLFNPLLRFVEKFVDRVIFGRSYETSQLVREYSENISNIVSVERLAVVAVRMIRDNLLIDHGALFLVRPKGTVLKLEPIKSSLPKGRLDARSPFARHLSQSRQPLMQYDLDMLPHYKHIADSEQRWLKRLDMEVYVPIHSQGEWIGLLALGPKSTSRRYFDEDLKLLRTLADQTAVALQNARLVEDLVRLNKDLEQAYNELDNANHQLRELDELKSAFIGVITHELRSPLINIDFSLQLIERYGLEHLSVDQQEQLAQLSHNFKAAKQMIDNLVSFASFLSKRGELSYEPVDIKAIIKDAITPNQPQVHQKNLDIQVEIADNLPALSGDSTRLTEAIYNLVHNAVKFTDSGGDIWVRCRANHNTVHFEVEDTGAGVPADKLPLLWENFAQMSDPMMRGVEGLGLGLALVKYVATAHGGDVYAESTVGLGSIFGFHVPCRDASKDASPALNIAVSDEA